jgi:hypothetical protein
MQHFDAIPDNLPTTKIELLEWRRNLAEQIVSQVWLPFASESMDAALKVC